MDKLHKVFVAVAESITPARSVSAFKEKGVLTPEEFVQAGDNLVAKCPTWSWEGGDTSRRKTYLPPGKQFLVTRNVPCLRRAVSIEEDYILSGGELLVDDDVEGGWLATHGAPKGAVVSDDEHIPSMDDADGDSSSLKTGERAGAQGEGTSLRNCMGLVDRTGEDSDDVPDMADYDEEDNLVETDPAMLQSTYLVAKEPEEDNILRTRTYDLSLTYDKFYQTPRVWLSGYDENRQPLRPEKALQDVSQDHAKKTVTVEDHPHLAMQQLSVHPCRHGAVMKKIIDVLYSRGSEPRVDQYLFIFLKFIASVIPTMEYDYTVDFDLGPSRVPS